MEPCSVKLHLPVLSTEIVAGPAPSGKHYLKGDDDEQALPLHHLDGGWQGALVHAGGGPLAAFNEGQGTAEGPGAGS